MLFINVLKNSKFLVWNDFNILFDCQTSRESKTIISLFAHAQSGQLESQTTDKLQVRFLIHIPIQVQNITFS